MHAKKTARRRHLVVLGSHSATVRGSPNNTVLSPLRLNKPERSSPSSRVLLHAASPQIHACVCACVCVCPCLPKPRGPHPAFLFLILSLSHHNNTALGIISPPPFAHPIALASPAFACGFQNPAFHSQPPGDWRPGDLETRRTPGQPPAAVQHAAASPSRRLSHSVDLGRQRPAQCVELSLEDSLRSSTQRCLDLVPAHYAAAARQPAAASGSAAPGYRLPIVGW